MSESATTDRTEAGSEPPPALRAGGRRARRQRAGQDLAADLQRPGRQAARGRRDDRPEPVRPARLAPPRRCRSTSASTPSPGVDGGVARARRRARRSRAGRSSPASRPTGAAGKALLDAVASVRLPKPVALHLTLARETRPALFDHSILMALLCAHLVRESGGAQGRRSRGRGRRPAARPRHAAHRARPARFRRAAERRRAAAGLRASADLVDAGRPLRRVLEGDRSRHRRAPRAARRLGLSARPRRRRDEPARPRPRPGRGRHRDVRRHSAACPSSASRCCCGSIRAATTPAHVAAVHRLLAVPAERRATATASTPSR